MKRMSLRSILLMGGVALLLLSGCSSKDVKTPVSSLDIFEQAKVVPLAVTQALSLNEHISLGLSLESLDSMYLYTLPSVDLYENPAVNITFNSPEPIADLWTYAAQLSREAGDDTTIQQDNESVPFTFTITGASTIHETMVTTGLGASMLIKLHRTKEKFAGASLDSIVAVDPQTFLLKDSNGNYWDVYDQTLVGKEDLNEAYRRFNQAIAHNNTPEFAAYMRQSWIMQTNPDYKLDQEYVELYDRLFTALESDNDDEADRLDNMIYEKMVEDGLKALESLKLQSTEEEFWSAWQPLTQGDGSLNLQQYKVELEKELSPSFSLQGVDFSGHVGRFFGRRWVEIGHLGNKRNEYIKGKNKDYHDYIGHPTEAHILGHKPGDLQATQGGYLQRRKNYNEELNPRTHRNNNGEAIYPQLPDRNGITAFDTIACATGRHVADKPLGCGPSAFIGLVGRKFNDGAVIDGMSYRTHTWQQLRIHMLDEIGINGRPRIANYMGTCYIGQDSSLSLNNGFINGGRRFLQDANARLYGRALTVRGDHTVTGFHKVGAIAKKNIIKQQVGRANNPVIAQYATGLPNFHYAPIERYFISVRIGKVTAIHVTTTDTNDRFSSLSNPWMIGPLGVYYIDFE